MNPKKAFIGIIAALSICSSNAQTLFLYEGSGIKDLIQEHIEYYGYSEIASADSVLKELSTKQLKDYIQDIYHDLFMWYHLNIETGIIENLSDNFFHNTVYQALAYNELYFRNELDFDDCKNTACILGLSEYHKCAIKVYVEALKYRNDSINLINVAEVYGEKGIQKFNIEDYYGAKSDLSVAIELIDSLYSKMSEEYKDFDASRKTYLYYRFLMYRAKNSTFLEDYEKALKYITICINEDREFNQTLGEHYFTRGIIYLEKQDYEKGCLDMSRSGELGHKRAYELMKQYCNK